MTHWCLTCGHEVLWDPTFDERNEGAAKVDHDDFDPAHAPVWIPEEG